MSLGRFVLRSLLYYARSHVGLLLGAAIGSAVLVGALVVGDSVRASIRRLTELRLGRVELAMRTGDRFFRANLFGQPGNGTLVVTPGPGLQARSLGWAPVLHLPAVVATVDGGSRANDVNLLCVDERFWAFAPAGPAAFPMSADGVGLNSALAQQLRVKVGDEIIVRAAKPSALSADAPLAPEERATVGRRLRVQALVGDERFGRFSLMARQSAPLNAFVPLAPWSQLLEAANSANVLLVREAGNRVMSPVYTMTSTGAVRVDPPTLADVARLALLQRWSLEDAQVRAVTGPTYLELRSPRVFLEPTIADALCRNAAEITRGRQLGSLPARVLTVGVLTYFVNEIRLGTNATPYSMVTAAAPMLVPPDMKDDEILISQWLADDLAAKPGDQITLSYYVVGNLRRLEERSTSFRVRAILPVDSPVLDRSLMPDFPGMTKADNCRDWDTGLPIQTDRIRPKDEQYWRDHRGTPKAFITLAAGQRIWSNRFGNLTAIRYYSVQQSAGVSPDQPARPTNNAAYWSQFAGALRQAIEAETLGLRFEQVRAEALASGSPSQDFGQLFLGFSVFIVVAALMLMSLLFQFAVEQRATETGILLAVGFKPQQVGWMLLWEAGAIALLGAVVGVFTSPYYARGMLTGLTTTWSQAIGGATLLYHAEPATMALGGACAAIVCWVTLWVSLRRHVRQPVHELLARGPELEWSAERRAEIRSKGRRWAISAVFSGVVALILVATSLLRADASEAGLFFAGGGLALASCIAACAALLSWKDRIESRGRLDILKLGLRNLVRRRRRSLAVIGMLACGCFLIAAIGVFRLDPASGSERRASGTGGFALIGQSTHAVVHDLDSDPGRDAYGLDAALLASVSVVPFRIRDGEDASCLNLGRVRQPRLLGVQPALLDRRRSFVFARVAPGLSRDHPWLLLERSGARVADDEVPAIGDQASLAWALGKKVGDTIEYADENGRPLKLRLVASVANSILQGSLIIAEDEFVKRFPNTEGYRFFLVDAPAPRAVQVSQELTRKLQDVGLEVVPAVERLAAFNAVQNTYLATFQALGGLGLVLGSVGLGVVVLRNVFERRGELGLLAAVGWRKSALYRLVLTEHAALLAAGLCAGVVSATLAVLPPLMARQNGMPLHTVALSFLAVVINGLIWTVLATAFSIRGGLIDALRSE